MGYKHCASARLKPPGSPIVVFSLHFVPHIPVHSTQPLSFLSSPQHGLPAICPLLFLPLQKLVFTPLSWSHCLHKGFTFSSYLTFSLGNFLWYDILCFGVESSRVVCQLTSKRPALFAHEFPCKTSLGLYKFSTWFKITPPPSSL